MIVAVEALALGGHVAQELGPRTAGHISGEVVAFGDELLDADLVDQADRTAGLRRETQPMIEPTSPSCGLVSTFASRSARYRPTAT